MLKLRPDTKNFISSTVNLTRVVMQWGFVPVVVYLGQFFLNPKNVDHNQQVINSLMPSSVGLCVRFSFGAHEFGLVTACF